MKILLPVDGSAASLRAVEQLVARRDRFAGPLDVQLLHVHQPIPIGRVQAHIGAETLRNYYLEDSQEHLAAASERLAAAGIAFVAHIHVGQPAEVIVRQAEALGCELIAMGTQGHGRLLEATIGSVTSRVIQLSRTPLLILK